LTIAKKWDEPRKTYKECLEKKRRKTKKTVAKSEIECVISQWPTKSSLAIYHRAIPARERQGAAKKKKGHDEMSNQHE
jgi:hypothetical protein